MPGILQFGAPLPGRDHRPRPGAYGVVFDARGRLLVVEEFARLYLPGGGLDPGETPEQALHREFEEETGYTVAIEAVIGEAREFVADETPGVAAAFNKHCFLFAVRLTGGTGIPAIPSNRPSWMPLAEALAALSNESHRWAVRRAAAERGGA
jgi:8-oxo-dGTP diphosphatase